MDENIYDKCQVYETPIKDKSNHIYESKEDSDTFKNKNITRSASSTITKSANNKSTKKKIFPKSVKTRKLIAIIICLILFGLIIIVGVIVGLVLGIKGMIY